MEANFRSASFASLPGATKYGLTDALVREGPIRSFAKPIHNENLWFLSAGSLSADSANVFSGDRIKSRFDELRREFDYLVVDGPSLTENADATALGRLTDGLVVVLEADSIRKEMALRVMENLRAAQIQCRRGCEPPYGRHARGVLQDRDKPVDLSPRATASAGSLDLKRWSFSACCWTAAGSAHEAACGNLTKLMESHNE